MKQRFYSLLTHSLPRALLLLLSFVLLAGCAANPLEPENNESIDADFVLESSVETPVVTIPPERKVTVTPQHIDTLLSDQDFSILFVNVGKADAAILRFGETTVLIDTGSAQSAPQLLAGLNLLSVTKIDAVFITHSHSDHLGGLDAISANYDIPIVYSPLYSEADKNGESKIVKRAEKLDLPHRELQAGDVVPITSDVSFAVLGPLSLNEVDDNDNSLVLQFTYGGKTFLFAGDMQFAEEQEIIGSGASLKSDVLKVGNHGNPDATGDDFAALVSPALAVISTDTSVDANSANPRVVAALSTAQVAITQDYPIGLLLSLSQDGAVSLQNPAREPTASSVVVSEFDVALQSITLTNNGTSPADLSGMILFSMRSDATLRFPEGTMLGAGESLIVGPDGDISFSGEDKPLSKKKDNTVMLYDRFGSLVSKLEK